MPITQNIRCFSRIWSIFIPLLLAVSPVSAQQLVPDLFSSAPGVVAADLNKDNDRAVIRQRPVVINFSALNQARPVSGRGTGGDRGASANRSTALSTGKLQLNLFDDVKVNVLFERTEGNQSGSRTWIGKVEGVEDSSVVLVVKDGVMVGNITLSGKFYQVKFVSNGLHAVHEIDQSLFPQEGEPRSVNNLADPQSNAGAVIHDFQADESVVGDANAADGQQANKVIDIMVVYTPAARAEEGGVAAIENLIDLAISESNTGYANSGINQRLNLVHAEEVSYTESGDMGTDRDRLRIKDDGHMDNVHNMRDTYSADVVTMIGYSSASYGFCGIAYIMETVAFSFEEYAFNVTARDCATGYYSFAHELGHIMSARHDWTADGTDDSPFTYNHGYGNGDEDKRSVMAYEVACGGGTCNRQNWWSNPDNGPVSPWGISEGLTDAADNRKTLNNTGFTVANFRLRKEDVQPSRVFPSGANANNGSAGVMFNLKAKKATTIHGFSMAYEGGTVSRVEIYYREGSYEGFEATPSAWKLIGSANNVEVNTSPVVTHIPINLDITIPAGQTYAFHIYDSSSKSDYVNGTTEGALFSSNDQLELYEGLGCGGVFSCTNTPRVFSGTIYHSYAEKPASLNTVSADNAQNGVMFDIHAKDDIVIHGFSSYLSLPSNNWVAQVEVYYRPGTHVGYENSSTGWTEIGLVDNVVASNSFGQLPYVQNRIPLEMSIPIPSGETYAFYITTAPDTAASIFYQTAAATGSISSANGQMEVLVGKGKAYPFAGTNNDRAFAGTVHYSYEGGFCFPIKASSGKIATLCL